VSSTDGLNKTTTFTYEVGDLVAVTTPLGHTETRFVDVAGRLLQVRDAKGGTTTFEYGNFDQVTKIVDPFGGPTTFTFSQCLARSRSARPQALDGNGNLLTLTDARSKTMTWTYDETALSPRGARAQRVATRVQAGVGPREL
jgi:YD repeat-containing protein